MHSIEIAGITIYHNGDWSGDAVIDIPESKGTVEEFGGVTTVTIPGVVIQAASYRYAMDRVVAFCQDSVPE